MMNNKQESIMSIAGALLVLFSTMLDPIISASLAVIMLIGFAIYKYRQSEQK